MKNKSKLIGCLAPLAVTAALTASDLKTPFESLPAETVAAFRFDNSPETLARYVDNTRLGQLLFSEAKIEQYKALIQDMIDADDGGANFVQKLGEVGLEIDDLYEMVSSHFGAAVVEQEVPDRLSMPTLLIWAEMRDGVAERAFQAVLEGSAENETIERTDLELPGGPGARIRNNQDGSSFIVAQLEKRFFFAIGQVREPVESMEVAKVFEDAELEAVGRFLAAQQEGGAEFLSSFYSDAGVSAARPDFESRLELLGDVQALLGFVPAKNMQPVKAIDLDQFTKIGLWSGLVDMEERSVVFMGAPAPRSGIAKLMENEFFEFQPPAWVPSSVNSYSAASFDMNKLYDFVLDIAKKFAPPEQVEQQVAMGNAQLQMMLQTDIPTLLSAFGKRFHIVEYPIEMISSTGADGEEVEIPRSSQAIVMDFTRPEILQAGLAMLANMPANPNANYELIEEQGFSGVRFQNPAQGAVTVGHGLGKLVFAVGSEETASRIFSTLSNVPEGEDALANSPELREYIAANGVKPGMLFSYSQGDQMLKSVIPVFESLGKSLKSTEGEDVGELVEKMLELIPSEEELEGVLGVAFSRMYYNESGIILEGSNQYK